jgi:DNA-binding response OmpR family regulator
MTKTILLVEDDENDVFFFTKALKKLNIENALRVASDGQQALDYFQGREQFANRVEFPLPDLVLLDLKLPRLRGLDVLKWIRQSSGSNVVVIVLSSSKNQTDIAEAYQLGANAYLAKPGSFDLLVETIRAVTDFWLNHNLSHQNGGREK